ncbi:hypothetical protein CsatA_011959 [Cannabis sativa]
MGKRLTSLLIVVVFFFSCFGLHIIIPAEGVEKFSKRFTLMVFKDGSYIIKCGKSCTEMRLKKRSTPSPPAPTRNSKKIHANTHLSYNNIPLPPPTLPPLKGLKAFLDESIPHK